MIQLPVIDPDDLAATLRVLGQLHEVPEDDPAHIEVKRAASHMYKALKRDRRTAKREAELAHDRAVTEATATGSALRIDDETLGIPLVSQAEGAFAGELINPRGCYICKNDYTLVDAFYHWLCPTCAAMSHAKRDQRTDLSGKRALLTGGRAKIGMYIALAAAPRRRAHHDHDPVPARRRPPVLRRSRTAPTGSTGSRSSASTCATRPR